MNLFTFITGSTQNSWRPAISTDTTIAAYWLNWRFFLCFGWVLMSIVFASVLVSKFEGRRNSEERRTENQQEDSSGGVLYEDEVWKPCLRSVHPGWLLAFRVVAFFMLLLMLMLNATVDGGSIFYFYTQWTFTLVLGKLGFLLSICGCRQCNSKDSGDPEHESYGSFMQNSHVLNATKGIDLNEEHLVRQIAEFWGYIF